MVDASTFLDALDRSDYRLTEPRRAVAQLVADQTGYFSAADLLREARTTRVRVGRATIFRTLDILVDIDRVERIDLPSGEHAYVACDPAHHHHVICSRCGRSLDIDDAGLRKVVGQIARRTGFRIDDHRLELFGLCPDCQAA
jgi:Fur family ferric uptake transcriptional regulator